MTSGTVIDIARARLGDFNKTGWSDDSLLSILDQGQKDLAKSAGVYKRTAYIGIVDNVVMYPLPDDCYQVNRVEYDKAYLSVLSREDQDRRYMPKGLHIIKNDLDYSVIEVSEPIINDLTLPTYVGNVLLSDEGFDTHIDGVEGSIVGSDKDLNMNSNLGCVVDIEVPKNWTEKPTHFGDLSGILYSFTSGNLMTDIDELGITVEVDVGYGGEELHGFLTKVDYKGVEGVYGLCTDALENTEYMRVYYSALPNKVSSIYSSLVVPDIWEQALVHYVVGTARQYDNDESNYKLGIQELKKYAEEVKKAKKLAARSYSSPIGEVKETIYRRI